MSSKIIRDPLYNYISIDRKHDRWLLELLDTPEIQRLRRIHQLGVSYLTYPGADHNRLAHSLGVVHLTNQALQHLARISDDDPQTSQGRPPVMASAMIHDVGHGPFSHVFEPCLGVKHEDWSRAIILSDETKVHHVLKSHFGDPFPRKVADLIDPNNHDQPAWQKYLLSSQLDMDRVDYLRRDSLFTGASYGEFDWFRILNTFEIYEDEDANRDIVWAEKSLLAIEEYIYSRYHMYQNVYLHKTTRGFERLLETMWKHARSLHDDGRDASLVPAIRDFWDALRTADGPSVRQYLAIEEYTVLSQIQAWTGHPDRALADLARRFLERDRLTMIEAPNFANPLAPDLEDWEEALTDLVRSRVEYRPAEMYCLRDTVKAKYNQPYFPEKESDEQSVRNAIRIRVEGEPKPVEVSELRTRLKPLTELSTDRIHYYIPRDLKAEATRLRREWER
ncbi:HD domain-containing protein [Singulisphaera sp. PoT]|uniref:HD domain-containing protein n=1 Tax=Singulisphaera sp. PoT TaxID=3411797 RepID=UPI003BF54A2E